MLSVFDEKAFIGKVAIGKLYRPSGFCFILIQRGTLQLEINKKRVDSAGPQIMFVSPMNIYKLIHFTEDISMYFIVHNRDAVRDNMNLDFSRYDLFQLINAEKNEHIFNIDNGTFNHLWAMANQLDFYLNHNRKTNFREQIVLSVFSTIIYTVADVLLKNIHSGKKISTRKETIAMDFIHLVSKHFRQEKELRFYANKLFISIKYLSICVKEVTGVAPTVIIADALLNESKLLLVNTSENISGISNDLNFSDQYAFGKFFKKHTGLSPRNYRRESLKVFVTI